MKKKYIVKLKSGFDPFQAFGFRDDVVGERKADILPKIERVRNTLAQRAFTEAGVVSSTWIGGALLVEMPPGLVKVLERDSMVESITEPTEYTMDYTVSENKVESDAANSTWGLDWIKAPDVWSEFNIKGSGVRVCVLDTGVAAPTHNDLVGKLPSNSWAEWSSSGVRQNSSPYDSDNHGTHVSGTIAGGDASGINIGVAPQATLMHGLVIPGGSGTDISVAAGMEWAVEPTTFAGASVTPADVISMSLGANGGTSSVMLDAARTIHAAGIPLICSAGNSGVNTSGQPGRDYEPIATGAIDSGGSTASFSSGAIVPRSQYSSPPNDWPTHWIVPNISAPGVDVFSSVPLNGYGTFNGTSMAAPHVSGAVALMLEADPTLTNLQIYELLEDYGRWNDRHRGRHQDDIRFGPAGVLDAYAAVRSLI